MFWGSVAQRTKGMGIPGLSWFEAANDAKVDQVNVTVLCAHNVGRLEIAEDDRRLTCMQEIKSRAQLDTNIEHFFDGEIAICC